MMQPFPTEKNGRTTLHYVIQNDSARDLVLNVFLRCARELRCCRLNEAYSISFLESNIAKEIVSLVF